MDKKKYTLLGVIIVTSLGGIVGYAVQNGWPVLVLLSVIIGVLLFKVLEKRVEEPLVDERVERVSEKASRRTLEVLGLSAALISALLISSGRVEGYVLAYVVCAALMLYITFYAIYSRGEVS